MPQGEISREFTKTLKLDQLPELSSLLEVSPERLEAIAKAIKRLGHPTGLDVGFTVPEVLSSYEPSAWKAFATIEKLKRLGWTNGGAPMGRLYPDEPKMNVYMVFNKDFPISSGFHGGGADFFSKEKALWAAVGEAIERHLLYFYIPAAYVDAPYAAVASRAIDLTRIAGVDPARRHMESQLQFDQTSVFRWVTGRSLTNGKNILLPLQLIYNRNFPHTDRGEPLLRYPLSTGAAAHTSTMQAELAGTLELLERDAFMVTWMNRLSPTRVQLNSIPSERLQRVLAEFRKFNLSVNLFYLPTDFDIHVVLAAITDPTNVGPALNVGAAAGFDLLAVLEKALSEVQTCRIFVRKLYEGTEGIRPATTFERPEQIQREERLLYWADPRHAHQASFLFAGGEQEFSTFPVYQPQSTKEMLRSLVTQFKTKDIELLSVPLIEPEIEKGLGFTAVQMVAPMLQPLHLLEMLPYNWGERLDAIPPLFGVTPAEEKNTLPHPFP